MRRFAAGVAVVTLDTGSERAGLTVNSLVSLSLDPPLVGVSIARKSPFHDLMDETDEFGVSLLAGGQDGIAQHFARSGVPPVARFHGIPLRPAGAIAAPLLDGALGWIECRRSAGHRVSTHTFFVGEAVALEPGRDAAALVYRDGRFHAL